MFVELALCGGMAYGDGEEVDEKMNKGKARGRIWDRADRKKRKSCLCKRANDVYAGWTRSLHLMFILIW